MSKNTLNCFSLLLLISNILITNLDYNSLNPAQIKIAQNNRYHLQLLTARTSVINNTLNLSDYLTHFSTDPFWDHTQKQTLFSLLPELGFNLNANISTIPVQLSTDLFNLSVYGNYYAYVTLPKDLCDFALFGNSFYRRYDFSKTQINSIKYLGASVGVNYPIILNRETYNNYDALILIRQLNVGARLHYQKGISITQTDSAQGSIFTTPEYLLTSAKIYRSTAQNADCYALDIGASTLLQHNIILGFAILNISTGFNWNQNPQQLFNAIKIDSFSIQHYLNSENIDSLVYSIDSAYPIPSFKTVLPAQILFQLKYQPIQSVMSSLYYHQYLQKSRFITHFTRTLNLNVDFTPIRFLQIGVSVTSDLQKEFNIGHNLCITIKKFSINLLANQYQGYFGKAKGIDFGLSFAQNW